MRKNLTVPSTPLDRSEDCDSNGEKKIVEKLAGKIFRRRQTVAGGGLRRREVGGGGRWKRTVVRKHAREETRRL